VEKLAEHLEAVSVRATVSYGLWAVGWRQWTPHGSCEVVPRSRLEIEIQDAARLVSWIVGMCEHCWARMRRVAGQGLRVESSPMHVVKPPCAGPITSARLGASQVDFEDMSVTVK